MRKTGFLIIIFNLVLFTNVFAAGSDLQIDLYNQGNDLFQKAVPISKSDPEEAKTLYNESLIRYLQIAESVQNAKLYYNIGNIYFQLGDMGRAILFYRKAALLEPGDINLKENLETARSQRVDTLDEKESLRIMETIFFLHYNLSASLKALFFGTFLGFAWISAALLFLKTKFSTSVFQVFKTITIVFSVLAIIFLGSVLIDTIELKQQPGGVITTDAIIARKGDGVSYSPSFEDPLHSGLEFVLINQRPGWYYIELPNNTRTWIPDNTADLVVLE